MTYQGRVREADGSVTAGATVVVDGVAYEMVWHCHRDAPPICPLWDTRPDITLEARGFSWEGARGAHWAAKRA